MWNLTTIPCGKGSLVTDLLKRFLEEVSTWRYALTETKAKIMDNNIRPTKTTAEVHWGHIGQVANLRPAHIEHLGVLASLASQE